jgi:hypothetical protein
VSAFGASFADADFGATFSEAGFGAVIDGDVEPEMDGLELELTDDQDDEP